MVLGVFYMELDVVKHENTLKSVEIKLNIKIIVMYGMQAYECKQLAKEFKQLAKEC